MPLIQMPLKGSSISVQIASIVNTNTSAVVIPIASPLRDNQTSLLLDGDGISSPQDSPKINDSLQAGREITSDDIRNKGTKLASEMAKEVLDKAEQTLNDKKIVGTNNSKLLLRQ